MRGGGQINECSKKECVEEASHDSKDGKDGRDGGGRPRRMRKQGRRKQLLWTSVNKDEGFIVQRRDSGQPDKHVASADAMRSA